MALPLKEANTAREVAAVLVRFLPGSGSSQWKGHVTFATAAREAGVGEFWTGGTKEPAVAALLERTLEFHRDRFERLILAIVRAGLKYCGKQGKAITRGEILSLNASIRKLGFKFPDLWDADFLNSLPESSSPAAPPRREDHANAQRQAAAAAALAGARHELRDDFYQLAMARDRQAAGLEFERLLNRLFTLYGLAPRRPFQLLGEQIDGSFLLDGEVYLLEAKWEAEPLPVAPLLVFREKIAARSHLTRGVFIAPNGISRLARTASSHGRQPNFVLVDGHDLAAVLEGQITLDDLVRRKVRRLAEEGEVFVSVNDLLT